MIFVKRIITAVICLCLLIGLTACGCKHEWSEATFNTPKTCVSCGEVEGEKLTPGSVYGLRDIVLNASASSVYAGDNLGSHGPELLYDGNLKTNWTENASGNGVGESVTFYLKDIYAVKQFHIYNGSHFTEWVYKENCRPQTLTLTFSDGSSERIALQDTYDEQVFVLSQYYYTDSITLTVDEVYTGTKYLDTVIAELDFDAYRP